MPSRAVMQYLLDMGGAKARYDEDAIVITPKQPLYFHDHSRLRPDPSHFAWHARHHRY